MADTPITNASTGVTPEQLGGSGPSTDLNAQNMPAGTTRVENGIAYDASGKVLGPVGGVATPPVAPAPKPKFDPNAPIELSGSTAKPKFDPNAPIEMAPAAQKSTDPTYAGHDFDPLNLGDWKRAFFGPTTAAGQPLGPGMQEDVNAVTDVLHGDIRKGTEKFLANNSMHVVQGSPIEKLIQEFNPSFKGAVDQNYIEKHKDTTLDHPLVDSAQFIDKQQHPVAKALTEVAQSLTSPQNTAIMIGTGGLGMVSSVRGLAVANKLLSAGFTAQALGAAYKSLEGFKKAYDEGDENEALYMLTHAVANGTMGYLAGSHAAGVDVPLASKADINAAKTAKNAVVNAPGLIAQKIGLMIGRTNDFATAIERSAKITPKQAVTLKSHIADITPDLQAIANSNPDIEGPKEFAEAIRAHNRAEEQTLLAKSGDTKDSTEPVVANAEQMLRERLDRFFSDNKGRYSGTDVEKAKQDILDHFLQRDDAGVDDQGNPVFTTRVPNLYEAENVRQGLNDLTRLQYNTNAQPTTSAFKAGAMEAANVMREFIDQSYENKGVGGVKEFRSKEAKKIAVADALEAAQDKADKMGEGGVLRSLMKKIGVPSTVIAIALGHPVSGAAIGAAVLGDQISQNLTNPNVNVQRALDLAAKNPNAKATELIDLNPPAAGASTPAPVPTTPPVNHALHAALSSHYGEIIGTSDPADLEARFYQDMQNKAANGVPLEPAEKQMLSKINDAKAQERIESQEAEKKANEAAQKDAEKKAAEKQKADEEKAAEEEKGQQKTRDSVAKELADKEKEDLKAKENPEKEPKPKPAGRTNLIGKLTHVVHPDNPEMAADQRIQRTPARALFGRSDESALGHEWAHAAQAAVEGLGSGDISSHLHPDSQPVTEGGAPAFGGVERGKAPWVENPNVEEAHTPEAILENTKKHVRVNMAGAVANEMLHGIPIEDNAGVYTDMAQAKQWLEAHGIEGNDADAMIQDAINQVREGFTKHPQILDAIKENSHVRERGLSPQLHASRERVAKFGDHIKDIIDANENNGPNGKDNQGNAGKLKPGAKEEIGEAGKGGRSQVGGTEVVERPQGGHAGGEVISEEELARPGRFVKVSRSGAPTDQGKSPDFNLRPGEAGYQVTEAGPKLVAGEESGATKRGAEAYHKEVFGKRANLEGKKEPELRVPFKEGRTIPPERTAGEHDAAIKAGGGVPGGIQKGDPEIDLPDLVLFHDPTTGSTLALKDGQVTPENVRTQIQKSRQTYLAAKPEESRIPTPGQPGYDEEVHGKSPEIKTQNDLRAVAKEINPNFNPAPVKPDPRESEIADAYKAAKHEPNNPAVKASYGALKRDIDSQYDALKKLGFKLETAKENPYGLSPEIPAHEELHNDVLRNKHLAVWEGGAPPADHPLSERDPKTGLTYNDKFRMVHDVFGHAAERTDFSPAGEESAWNLHRQLFSPEARPALAAETRGQAAYAYKYGDFPPQKATILPEHLQVRPEDLGKRAELRGAVAEPTLSDGLVDKYGQTDDPLKAGFILNDGRMVPLSGEHDVMLNTVAGNVGGFGPSMRENFINNENAIRTRYRTGKGGQEVVFSVPKSGVNEEQIQRMRQSVGKIRNGNAVMEIAEPGGKFTQKEFARPSDIDSMLREIGAHPDSKSWIPDVTKQVAGGVNPENPEAESKRYGFEIHPESRQALEANPTADDFQKYADQTKEIRQAHPDIKLGWDTTGDNPELNIGASTDDRQLAEEMAKKLDRRSIYDTKEDKVIPTGGTGTKTEFPEYPFEQRLEDLNTGRSELRGTPPKVSEPPTQDEAEQFFDKRNEVAHRLIQEYNENIDNSNAKQDWELVPANRLKKIWNDYAKLGFVRDEDGINKIADTIIDNIHKISVNNILAGHSSENPEAFAEDVTGEKHPENHFYKNDSFFDDEKGIPRISDYGIDKLENGALNLMRAKTPEEKLQAIDGILNVVHQRSDLPAWFVDGGTKTLNQIAGRSELRGKPADVKKAKDTTEVHPVGSSVVLRENPLPVKPSPGADIPSTVDVAMALTKYTKKQLPTLELGKAQPQEMVDRAKSLAEDEARYQLAQNNTGAAWYTTQMADHDRILQGMRPETVDPAKLSMFKFAEAILSSGQKPYANFKTTVRAWDQYQETGKFPPLNPDTKKSWGPRGIPAYGNAFESLNRLIGEKGEQGTKDWLLSEHPVSELKDYNPNVKGKKDDMQLGALILGPKRGPFSQNLHGLESAFTADMWVARTWHRWMGTTEIAPDGELATDRPRSDKERELMKKSFSETADKLGMTTSSLQAVLWYYEQALYSAHGSPKESWSFSDAAQRVADDEASTFNFGHNVPAAKSGLDTLAGK